MSDYVCDAMAVCLPDIQNDSCYPRTLGTSSAEVFDEPSSWSDMHIPDFTIEGVFTFLAMFFGTIAAFGLLWHGLAIWFRKYKLQYLLRMSLLLFLATNILCKVFPGRTGIHEDYDFYISQVYYLSAVASFVMLIVRYYWKQTLNIVKAFHEVGFEKKDVALARERNRQKLVVINLREFPPCFPNGWIPLIESCAIQRGQQREVQALDIKFIVFRGQESGDVFVLYGYCRHLGSNLATQGIVEGDSIVCSFHGWRCNGRAGACTRGPSSDPRSQKPEVPANVRAHKYHSRDVNGMIYVWYHAEDDQQEPTWEIPRVEAVCSGQWKLRGRTEHVVCCHIQEIPENGADINHLQQLHSSSVLLGNNWMDTQSWWNIVSHEWDPEWRRDENQPHVARIKLKQTSYILGMKLPFSKLDIDVEQIGPACVHLHIKSSYGRALLIQDIVPEGPLTMKVIHRLYTEPSVPQFWADLLIRAEAVMLERDIVVWNNKKYLKNPALLKDEKSIKQFRKWYGQFYSENSPRVTDFVREY